MIPEEALAHFREAVGRGGDAGRRNGNGALAAYAPRFPDLGRRVARRVIDGELPDGLGRRTCPPSPRTRRAWRTRAASGKVLNALAPRVPTLIGGSADLDPFDVHGLEGLGDFQDPPAPARPQGAVGGGWSSGAQPALRRARARDGRHRERSRAAWRHHPLRRHLPHLLRLHAPRPSGSPRSWSCTSSIVFTHDSIGVGEDGPTHQPVEQSRRAARDPRSRACIRPATPTRPPSRGRWRSRSAARSRSFSRARTCPRSIARASRPPEGCRARRVRALRGADGGNARPDPHRHRIGGARDARGAAIAGRQRRRRRASSRCRAGNSSREQPQKYVESVLPSSSARTARGRGGLPAGLVRLHGRRRRHDRSRPLRRIRSQQGLARKTRLHRIPRGGSRLEAAWLVKGAPPPRALPRPRSQ